MNSHESISMDNSPWIDQHPYSTPWQSSQPETIFPAFEHQRDATHATPVTPLRTVSNNRAATPASSQGHTSYFKQAPDRLENAELEHEHARLLKEMKSDTPLVISAPPQKRPPKIAATYLAPASGLEALTASGISQQTINPETLPFTPSLLLLSSTPSSKNITKRPRPTNGTHNSNGFSVWNAPPKHDAKPLEKPSVHGEDDTAMKSIRDTKLVFASMFKSKEKTSINVGSNGRSSPTKRPAAVKTRFIHVPEDEYMNKETLVDRPPVLFRKRITRSGKEFHSEDEDSSVSTTCLELESQEGHYDVRPIKLLVIFTHSMSPAHSISRARTKACQTAGDVVRSSSGIKTRGIKAMRGRGAQARRYIIPSAHRSDSDGRTRSRAQLARPILYDGTPGGRSIRIRDSSEEFDPSDCDLFVPKGRWPAEANDYDIKQAKNKVNEFPAFFLKVCSIPAEYHLSRQRAGKRAWAWTRYRKGEYKFCINQTSNPVRSRSSGLSK